MDGRAGAGNYPAGHFLWFGEPLFHQDDDVLREYFCPAQQIPVCETVDRWTGAEFAYLPVAVAIW